MSFSNSAAIGIMEGAFFVSKSEILAWLNALLKLSLQKVEQCATGAVYCQVIDALYPGTMQLSKVNWKAKVQYEFLSNYKLLQQGFDRNNIHKHIEVTSFICRLGLTDFWEVQVDKLIKAKYQDNLEFLQWIKRYFDMNHFGHDYDPVARRKGAQLYLIGASTNQQSSEKVKTLAKPGMQHTQRLPLTPNQNVANKSNHDPSCQNLAPTKDETEVDVLKSKVRMLEMRLHKEQIEKDFFFSKLSSIDTYINQTLVQQPSNHCAQELQKVLFATEEESVTINNDLSIDVVNTSNDRGNEEALQ